MELNQNNFRRLVQLQLLLLLATFFVFWGFEYFGPEWSEFSAAFDALVEEQFGAVDDRMFMPAALVGLTSLVWSLAATIGLLKFRRWARWGYWVAPMLFLPILFMPGSFLYYTTPLYDVLVFADWALFGAILAIAYSPEHGGRWFASPKLKRE